MINHPINLEKKFKKFTDHWSPKVIGEMNDYQFKLAKVKGDFIWHHHLDTDETFFVLKKLRGFYEQNFYCISDCTILIICRLRG